MTTNRVELLEIPDLPFMVGHQDKPHNPTGIPDRLPFKLVFDTANGLVVRAPDPAVEGYLAHCYNDGSLLGTAMDETELGRPYALDFLGFVQDQFRGGERRRGLEIGAGRGYLMRLFQEQGFEMLGIEPGAQNQPHWERHGVQVIKGSFPHVDAKGPFDVAVAYAVLEHVRNPIAFLKQIASRMEPNGLVAISVPDCTTAFENYDLSILLHEHLSYFTERSLKRIVSSAGLKIVSVQAARYGGAIYCAAAIAHGSVEAQPVTVEEYDTALAYGRKSLRQRERAAELLVGAKRTSRTVGLYCPARAINILPVIEGVRFFDDDPELTGRYYPPFPAAIENRSALIERPVDELWIMSRTFGQRIASDLANMTQLARTAIHLGDKILQA